MHESINSIFDKCFPGSQPYDKESDEEYLEIVRLSEDKGRHQIIEHSYTKLIRLKSALRSTKCHKASGPDQIKPIVLKQLSDNVLRHMVRLYDTALTLEYTPLTWRKSNVTMLPKPGKSDYQNPKSFQLEGWHLL